MEAIKTENLTKHYGKARGIEQISLTVEEGEFFGFIGPNGAGKSTTIRTLLGLISPTGGQAAVLGFDIVKEKEKILAGTGYLPSEAMFHPGMRVREVLKLSADLRKKDCRKAAVSLCERLQLDTSRKVDELSFGNRKKVAIVCALQHDPRLLVLDEPTSGLDPLMQKAFSRSCGSGMRKGRRCSCPAISYPRYSIIAAIIREGRILVCDSVEALSQSNARRVTVHGSVELEGLPGVRDRKESEGVISFLYSGDMKALLRMLAAGDVSDLSVSEPDLEEIFMHYYEK